MTPPQPNDPGLPECGTGPWGRLRFVLAQLAAWLRRRRN